MSSVIRKSFLGHSNETAHLQRLTGNGAARMIAVLLVYILRSLTQNQGWSHSRET